MAGTSKYTPQEKVEIVLIGLKSPGSISELCHKMSSNKRFGLGVHSN